MPEHIKQRAIGVCQLSLGLYAITVLIWGTTFFAVTMQVGEVPAEQSVFYRYLSAAIIMWLIVAVRRDMPRFSISTHYRFIALGFCMFSLNYVVVYMAVERLVSGLVSVVFSMTILINTFQMWLIYSQRPDSRLLIAATLGISGLTLLFLDEILSSEISPVFFAGLAFAFTAAFSAGTGNIVSHRLSMRGVNVVHANTWSMTYGAALTLAYILYSGKPMQFDTSIEYIASLGYLSLFGTVIAFYAYLTLVANIGAPRASYVSILYSTVALIISTLLEDMNWTALMLLGVVMIMAGNVIVLSKPRAQAQ